MEKVPEDWVDDPPSEDIAEILNSVRAEFCPHGRLFCAPQCGVRQRITGEWAPIARNQRHALRNLMRVPRGADDKNF